MELSQAYSPINTSSMNKPRNSNVPSNNNMPSMKNMYASDYWYSVRNDEKTRSTNLNNDALNPYETGVVPKPAYASMFMSTDFDSSLESNNQIKSLSGETLSKENFQHNNMKPYFKGTVRQNLDPNANQSLLNNYTGRSDLIQHKKEQECLFEPVANMGNVCGMADNTDFYESRIVKPSLRNNDFPIQQIHVGPGLAAGYTSNPDGGYSQNKTLDYTRPKTVDELRVLTNPKITYELPTQGPKGGISQRGFVGKVSKNRTESWFEQTPDMWLKTSGAYLKDRLRPVFDNKPTSRVETHIDYKGVADGKAAQPGNSASGDFNIDSYEIYDNERQCTQGETMLGNLKSTVNAIIAPLLDVFRHSNKEYTIDAPRESGIMKVQIPEKPTTYDPVNHMMRTTIKETLIHDTTIANLRGRDKTTAAFTDEAKKTVRQTLPLEDTERNIGVTTYKVTSYNTDAVKTTIRETIPCATDELGFIGGTVTGTQGGYKVTDIEVQNTQKQFTSDKDYYGVSESATDFRPMSEEMYDNAEIDPTRESINLGTDRVPGAGGKYTALAPDKIDMEVKKLTSDYMNQRETNNITRVATVIKPIESCEVTKQSIKDLNFNEDRLDSSLLSSLRSNPYNININPI